MKKRFLVLGLRFLISLCLCVSAVPFFAQTETPPEPSTPKSVKVPAVVERKLPNGLTVAVVQKTASPIVTIQLLVKCGASCEDENKAGLANLTADMLTKGTKTRTATQIAEEIEFLGGSISSGAGWNSSFVTITVTSDKVAQAMAILSDVILNPKFAQSELDLLKTQTLDGLTYDLKQPSFLANYVASKYSFGEHPAGGTKASIESISRSDILSFWKGYYETTNSVLIFTGAISPNVASQEATRSLSLWRRPKPRKTEILLGSPKVPARPAAIDVNRLLVIDLPKSGQAAVNYAKKFVDGRVFCPLPTKCETETIYFPAVVLNSVLGGGYSSRLNYEIRIKRGLSYGAGSSIGWRGWDANFGTRVQTKNESAAEVSSLVIEEIKKLTAEDISANELIPRKSVLTGGFGRSLETTSGLANAIADLYIFGLSTNELNRYVNNVNAVTDVQLKAFANNNLRGGDIIIVGDYSIFKDDLAKRFPGMKIEVIKADGLDLSKL